ncbi:probable chromo domain-containing protein LHP1 isoform X2 [Phragmites australis]|uniref:probable chromo domain-containing protein LHP1 isoform X2 n=1 Tax=Phragmites australis TaxID=29695 RepID=UPI002D76D4C6|nr:probable chromo domain-containing protein LHP1 isoform X2 [Phragmites australis]
MGRSRKDSLAVDGSGDPAAAVEEEEVEEEEQSEEGEEEEEEWEEEEEEEREGGEEKASGETAAQEGVEGSPPKLAEGFFEIEAIRRRRLRKGKLQYLVKWRGWPESANTWEPLENLKACSDIVDAFEKRSRSPRSSRKRKRKATTTPTTDPNPSSRGKRGRPPRSEARSLPRPPAPEPKILPCRTSSRRASNNSNKTVKTSFVGLEASVNVLGQRVVQEGSSGVVSDGLPSQGAPLSVSLTDQQDEHHPVNNLSKVDNSVRAPPSQGGQVTGAKKRKSGCVRRFKQDEATQEQGDLRDHTSEKPGNEYVDSTEGETGDKNKGEDCASQIHITKIIKPVRYFATVLDGVQQVSITFKALRSDGEEVFVDDKELKANNPLVLIDYYEQHLRYNPTS